MKTLLKTITSKNGSTIKEIFSFTEKKELGCSETAKVITNKIFKVIL